jgi:hypothetical protein
MYLKGWYSQIEWWIKLVDVACHISEELQRQAFSAGDEEGALAHLENKKEMFREGYRVAKDVLGNPFHPASFNPSWRTRTTVNLAQAIYDERAFDRMPILGDALEEAGCTDAEILNHCRQPGEHVKGCWVVDSVLGKT